jgi:hypothetical protein
MRFSCPNWNAMNAKRKLALVLVVAVLGISVCVVAPLAVGVVCYFKFRQTAQALVVGKEANDDEGKTAVFDPNDLESTRRWALKIARGLDKLNGNEVAISNALKTLDDENKKHIGKKVRWAFPVQEVTEKDDKRVVKLAYVQPKAFWVEMRPPTLSEYNIYLKIGPAKDEAVPFDSAGISMGRPLSFEIGRNITRERAAKLRAGGTVVVSGTIRDIQAGGMKIFLGDLKAE